MSVHEIVLDVLLAIALGVLGAHALRARGSRQRAERNLLQRGREAGARGYVLKEAGHDTIVRAIDRVSRGEDFIDPALAPSLLELSRESLITGREREILQLLADGMSNADVAQKLFISQETVKSHVRHILAKLEADNRTQAVAIALRESIIE